MGNEESRPPPPVCNPPVRVPSPVIAPPEMSPVCPPVRVPVGRSPPNVQRGPFSFQEITELQATQTVVSTPQTVTAPSPVTLPVKVKLPVPVPVPVTKSFTPSVVSSVASRVATSSSPVRSYICRPPTLSTTVTPTVAPYLENLYPVRRRAPSPERHLAPEVVRNSPATPPVKMISPVVSLGQLDSNATRAPAPVLHCNPSFGRKPSRVRRRTLYDRFRSPPLRRDLDSDLVQAHHHSPIRVQSSRNPSPERILPQRRPSPPVHEWSSVFRNPPPIRTPPSSRSPSPVRSWNWNRPSSPFDYSESYDVDYDDYGGYDYGDSDGCEDGMWTSEDQEDTMEVQSMKKLHLEKPHPHVEDMIELNKVEVVEVEEEVSEQEEEEEDGIQRQHEDLPIVPSGQLQTAVDHRSAILYVLRNGRLGDELNKVPRFVKKVVVDYRSDDNMDGYLFSFEFPDGSPRFGVAFNGKHRHTFRWVHHHEILVVSHRHTSRFSSDPVDLLEMLLLGAEVEEVICEIPVCSSRLSRLSSVVHSLTVNTTYEGAQTAHLLLQIKGLKEIKVQGKWLDKPTVPKSLLLDRGLSALSSLSLHFQFAPNWIPLSHLRLSSLSFIFEKPIKHLPFVNKDKKVISNCAVGNKDTTGDFITNIVKLIEKWIDDWFNDKRAIDSFLIKCSIYNFTRLRPKFIVRGINWKKGLGTVVRPKDGTVMRIRIDPHEFRCFTEKGKENRK